MEPVERRRTGVEIRTFPRLPCQSSENFHSLRVFAFDGASFSTYGRAESHSAVQRSPRSHSSASLTSRSASALSFVARASLRYRTARAVLMATQIPTQQEQVSTEERFGACPPAGVAQGQDRRGPRDRLKGAELQSPRSHTAATDLKPAASARRVFFFGFARIGLIPLCMPLLLGRGQCQRP